MDASIFTSSVACERIAGRAIRDLSLDKANPCIDIIDTLTPSVGIITDKGKMTRNDLMALTRRVKRRLSETKTVIRHSVIESSQISTAAENEGRAFYLQGGKDEQWMELWAVGMRLSRKHISVSMTNCEFRVHKHALSRYMSREMKSPEEFKSKIIETAHLAIPIMSGVAAYRTDQHIALPLMGGMLLGKMHLFEGYGERLVMASGQGYLGSVPRTQASMVRDWTTEARMMTYVDADSMTQSREALHKLLVGFAEKHGATSEKVFNRCFFESWKSGGLTRDETASFRDDIKTLVTSPEWDYFAKTVDLAR